MNQPSHQSREPLDLIVRIAVVDSNVLSLDEARFLQAPSERAGKILKRRLRRAAEKPDDGDRTLLRARRERTRCDRGGNTAEKRDEIAPPHVIALPGAMA
jgi:hypothetical protein